MNMTPEKAATTIQRIADSGLDIPTGDYRELVEVAQWLNTLPEPQQIELTDEEQLMLNRMKRLFAMLEDEALSIRHTMIALTEVYADAARMAQENQSKEASK